MGSRRSVASRRSSSSGSAGVAPSVCCRSKPRIRLSICCDYTAPPHERRIRGPSISVHLPARRALRGSHSFRCCFAATAPFACPRSPSRMIAWVQHRQVRRSELLGMAPNSGRQAAAIHLDNIQTGAQTPFNAQVSPPSCCRHECGQIASCHSTANDSSIFTHAGLLDPCIA